MERLSIHHDGKEKGFDVKEITTDSDSERRFEITDIFSRFIIFKSENKWQQETSVPLDPTILTLVGSVIESHYQLNQ
ncbi:hypothetical protein IM792_09165 [Mucilaginibacter sp. JRF]|uniref:hypothetical protein n=1 Tax=Mucilaginibacter sp. JRF TaxID=2780088 RepID=UPI00187EA956|nr:hypothetical protein [Mucilaginibacter sp. JRF]MBE9584613.1 hypothetical protein [Mucilaginibacter sp. JRF]